MLALWIVVFVVSLAVLVKGADWFLDAAERIGLAWGLSPFVIGVVIVGLGTSFPELVSSFAAILKGATEIVAANAAGSNIANILLVVGLSALVGRRLVVGKNLIDLDIPLLAISTALFLGAAWDGSITFVESALLVVAYGVYLAYTMLHEDDAEHEPTPPADILPDRAARRRAHIPKTLRGAVDVRAVLWLLAGLAGLVVGAKYLIDSVIAISEIANIGTGVIALAAVALGTSLPEIIVSVKAARAKKYEVALGNVFGSNVFNVLVVTGLPGLFGTLVVDAKTLSLGLPVLAVVTLLFVISGISRRVYAWEGAMYLLVYIFFIGKLFALF